MHNIDTIVQLRLIEKLYSLKISNINSLFSNKIQYLVLHLVNISFFPPKNTNNKQTQIRKLESRIMELENDLDTEARRSADVIKTARKSEKKLKELQFGVEDEKKTAERAQDTADKLNQKLKKMRMQLEEAVSFNSSSSFLRSTVGDMRETTINCYNI